MRHHGCMELRAGLTLDDDFVVAFAAAHGVRRIALYGSALREDFRSDSDIDILVEFEPGRTPGLLRFAQMELELEDALGRQVELRTPRTSAPTSATPSPRPPDHSMQPEDRHRLRHLTDAATKAIAFSSGKRRSDLNDDELLRLALTKLVEIVGEAAKNLSPAARDSMPGVPWRAAARMRAAQPGGTQRTLEAHRANSAGLCCGCGAPGTGSPHIRWPCPVAKAAQQAACGS